VKTRFIVNPHSGAARRVLGPIRAYAARHAAAVELTTHPRHASALARRALDDGCACVVAVGGDGTMNEIAAVLTGTSATLALVPCGSGNGLARHLGLHGSCTHALGVLASGRPLLIDTGMADQHPFFTVAGLGFEAHLAERFNRLQRRGFWRYLAAGAKALRGWQPIDCVIAHAGRRETVRALTVAVANGDQYGNNARIAPGARVDDGLLDLCAVPPLTLGNAVPLAVRLFAGSLARAPGVVLRRAEHFSVERPAPGPLHTDGEIHAAGSRIEFSIRPASLRILVPDAARGPGDR
jgi:YegS/Rv2252/BmrU family lipid kinase